MKILKNFKVILALILGLSAIGLLVGYCARIPSSEITRAQLIQLLDAKQIAQADVTPMIYQGIYSVQGSYSAKSGAKPASFNITTHLDEQQVKALLALSMVKVDV